MAKRKKKSADVLRAEARSAGAARSWARARSLVDLSGCGDVNSARSYLVGYCSDSLEALDKGDKRSKALRELIKGFKGYCK